MDSPQFPENVAPSSSLDQVLKIAKLAMFVSITLAALSITVGALYEIGPARAALAGLQNPEASLKAFADKATTEVTNNGDEAHRVLVEAGLTAKEARLEATSQRQFWDQKAPEIVKQFQDTIAKTNDLLTTTGSTVDSLKQNGNDITSAVQSVATTLNPNLEKVGTAFEEAGHTMNAAGKVIGDQSIPKTLADLQTTMHEFSSIAQHSDNIIGNVDKKVDSFMHPTFWGRMSGIGLTGLDLVKSAYEIHYYNAGTQVVVAPAANAIRHVIGNKPKQ